MRVSIFLVTFLFSILILRAAPIGINFTNGDADKSLINTDSAGVENQVNWNGHTNATGVQTTNALKDSNGVTTTASISTNFGFANANSGGTGTANDKLYRAYGLIFGTESVSVTSLPTSITENGYHVIVYFDINLNVDARISSYTINSATLAGIEDSNFFSGVFKKSTGTSLGSATEGNYVRFEGLTGNSFSITGAGNIGRAPICGIQIIPAGDSPIITSFTSSSNKFEAGKAITLQWAVTGSTSVSIDQGIGNVPASGSVTVTPNAETTYTLTAVNNTNSVTSQVSLILDKGLIDVYLLGGQSNMQGTARVSKLSSDLSNIPEIMLYASGSGVSGNIANQWVGLQPSNGNTFGPEIGFGEQMRDLHPEKNIALIKFSASGNSLEINFKPGANTLDTANWGGSFTSMVNTYNDAIVALEADGWEPVIKGMCWQQGEQDAKDGLNVGESNTSADDYGANLSHFIDRIREQFSSHADPAGIRFIIGQVLPYAPVGGNVKERFPGRDLVRQAELDLDENSGAALAKNNTASIFTDSANYPSHENEIDGYRDSDEVHLNHTALINLGREMAQKMLKLTPQTYSQWAVSHNVSGDSSEDDDNDGSSNIEEFYHGTSPGDKNSSVNTIVAIEDIGGQLYLTATIRKSVLALSITETAQVGIDLAVWNDGVVPLHVSTTADGEFHTLVKYRSPWLISSQPRIFMRYLLNLAP